MNQLNELREAMARLDATITHHADMTDAPDRPPTGDDYNALFNLVEGWLKKADAQVPALERRLRDIAAGARSKADLIASKSPTSVYADPVDVLRALAKEAEKGLEPDPDKGLEIQRTLVVSTAHLPQLHLDWLHDENRCNDHTLWSTLPTASDPDAEPEAATLIVDPIGDYGWRICVTGAIDKIAACVVPEDPLLNLLRFAEAHNCDWLALDRDGPTIPDLPTFED